MVHKKFYKKCPIKKQQNQTHFVKSLLLIFHPNSPHLIWLLSGISVPKNQRAIYTHKITCENPVLVGRVSDLEIFDAVQSLEIYDVLENLEIVEAVENLEIFEAMEGLEIFEDAESLEIVEAVESLEIFEVVESVKQGENVVIICVP